jgi:hypothetical protein
MRRERKMRLESGQRAMNPESSVSDIVFDPTNPPVMYVADGGATWTPLSDGLLIRNVNALGISSDGQHLYAASEGGGVFRLDLSGESPESAVVPTSHLLRLQPPLCLPQPHFPPGPPRRPVPRPPQPQSQQAAGACAAELLSCRWHWWGWSACDTTKDGDMYV